MKKTLPFLLPLALCAATADGAVLLRYTFDTDQGNPGNAGTFSPTTDATGTTGSAITFGAGALASSISTATPGSTGNRHMNLTRGATVASTQATARSTDTYGQFTITADSGYTLNLRNQIVSFDLAKGGNDGNRQIFLDVSLDAFASFTNVGGPTSAISNTAFNGVSYNLPDTAAYENLGPGSTVTFRLYTFADASNRSVRVDNLTVNGTAVIPEPSAALLVTLGGLFLLRRKR